MTSGVPEEALVKVSTYGVDKRVLICHFDCIYSSLETEWMSSAETGQMSTAETGHMSALETRQVPHQNKVLKFPQRRLLYCRGLLVWLILASDRSNDLNICKT